MCWSNFIFATSIFETGAAPLAFDAGCASSAGVISRIL